MSEMYIFCQLNGVFVNEMPLIFVVLGSGCWFDGGVKTFGSCSELNKFASSC